MPTNSWSRCIPLIVSLLSGYLTVSAADNRVCTSPPTTLQHQQCPIVTVTGHLHNNQSTVALILARGGSKGVPLKNLRTVHGLSLLARSIETIWSSGVFDEVWVSTDHDGIAAEAQRFGAHVHLRPESVSRDQTTSIESVREFLQHHGHHIDAIALVQCTSVFLRPQYLREAMRQFVAADCVFAVVRSHKLRWQWHAAERRLRPLNFDAQRRPRRQDWTGDLAETGMFYVATGDLLRSGRFQNDKCVCVCLLCRGCDWDFMVNFPVVADS